MRPRAVAWLLLAVAVVLGARRWLDTVEVRGRSMAPALLPGDRLLVIRARPRDGDVVLAPDPGRPERELVKRVAALDRGGIALSGDNGSASTDAIVERAAVRWRAVACYWPLSRIGLVRSLPRPNPVVLAPGDSNIGKPHAGPVGLAPGGS